MLVICIVIVMGCLLCILIGFSGGYQAGKEEYKIKLNIARKECEIMLHERNIAQLELEKAKLEVIKRKLNKKMMLTFEGKGCNNCPCMRKITVYDYGREKEVMLCNLSKRKLADGSAFLLLYPNGVTRPEGCPFVQFPNTLEIQAQE